MRLKIVICTAALLFTSACQNTNDVSLDDVSQELTRQNPSDIEACVRTVLKLDEGKWAYMGTIARGNGMFRTFATTSEHAAAGPDTWSYRSYGGDIGEEGDAETSYSKLVGLSLIPLEDDVLQHEDAVKFISCAGPDAEGRYEVMREYALPHMDDRMLSVKNMTWYSEHGSYYAEDIFEDTGRVLARRSGVNTPIEE